MKVRKILADLARAVADEAERNPDFAERIADALKLTNAPPRGRSIADHLAAALTRAEQKFERSRAKNRRPAALLDPVAIAREGEQTLRSRLAELSLDQLRDVVADQGMDPGKLVMKWKTPDRVIDRIVEISLARAQKGDAFRPDQ